MKRLMLLFLPLFLLPQQLSSTTHAPGCTLMVTSAKLKKVRKEGRSSVDFELLHEFQFVGEPCTQLLFIGLHKTLAQGLCKGTGLAGSTPWLQRGDSNITLRFNEYRAPRNVEEKALLEQLIVALQTLVGANSGTNLVLTVEAESDEWDWMQGSYPAIPVPPPLERGAPVLPSMSRNSN